MTDWNSKDMGTGYRASYIHKINVKHEKTIKRICHGFGCQTQYWVIFI